MGDGQQWSYLRIRETAAHTTRPKKYFKKSTDFKEQDEEGNGSRYKKIEIVILFLPFHHLMTDEFLRTLVASLLALTKGPFKVVSILWMDFINRDGLKLFEGAKHYHKRCTVVCHIFLFFPPENGPTWSNFFYFWPCLALDLGMQYQKWKFRCVVIHPYFFQIFKRVIK